MSKLKNCLINEKVILEYIPKESIFKVEGSPALLGMHEKSIRSIPAPVDTRTGLKLKFLDDDEIAFLSSELGTDLSFKADNPFWENYTITLTIQRRVIDLTSPMDYIDFKALQHWPFIAKNPLEKNQNPKSFRWVLIRPNEIAKVKSKSAMDKGQAWRLFGKNEKDKDLLLYLYYKIKGKTLDRTTPLEDIPGYFEEILDTNAASFIFNVEQANIKTNALIYNAMLTGVVIKRGDNFMYNGKKLSGDDEVADMENATNYLLRPINQTIKYEIEGLLAKKKEEE